MKHLTIFSTLLLFLLGTNSAFGADFQKGVDAYEKGDYATALREWRSLAIQGDADAQYALGVLYDSGDGVSEDDREAVKWYRMAAEQGQAWSQFNLAGMYDDGEGVEEDDVVAYAWFKIASANGTEGPRMPKLTNVMNPDQIAKAEALAKEMIKKNPNLIKEKQSPSVRLIFNSRHSGVCH